MNIFDNNFHKSVVVSAPLISVVEIPELWKYILCGETLPSMYIKIV